MADIAYSRESYNRCNCGGCPVQRHSQCVQDQEERLRPLQEALQRDGVMPDPSTMPGLYCATPVGRTGCEGLDNGRVCLCPACALAIMEGLSNSYYCLRGSARELGG